MGSFIFQNTTYGLAPKFSAASSIDLSSISILALIFIWAYDMVAIVWPIQTVVIPRGKEIPKYFSLNKNNINKENPTIISGVTVGIIIALLKNFDPKDLLFLFVVTFVASNPNIMELVADMIAIFKLVIADWSNSWSCIAS